MTGRSLRMLLLAGACLGAVPAHADTLQEALTLAYDDNPTLEAARAQQRATDESVVIQEAGGRASVSTSANYTEYLKQSSSSFISPERVLSANADLTIPIYSGGSVKNGVKAADKRVLAGRAGLRGTESSLFAQVVAAYMDVMRNEAVVSLSKKNVDVLKVNLQATSDRYEIGDLTRTDVAQSESRLALARGDLRAAQSNLVAARENYVALVGKAPEDLQPPPPLPGLPKSVDEAVSTALMNNPDLLAARERAKASGYDIDVAGAGRLPKVELYTSGSYQDYLGTLGSFLGGPAQQVSTAAQAGVRFSMPLFQGGRVAAQQRQAQANASAALEQVVSTERSVISQVRSAYSSWQAANEIIKSTQSAVDAATLSLEGVRAENSVGNRTILDVLNAQQELVNSQVQLVTARRNAYVAGFSLLAAMGQAEARDLGIDDKGVLYDPVANYDRVHGKIWDWDRDPEPEAKSSRTVDIPAQDAEIPDDKQTGQAN
jgi:outer membrane protein